MVQVAARNGPTGPRGAASAKAKVKTQLAPGGVLPGSRVKSAKELRQAFVDVQQSPDGIDPEPLTVPKCVECGNCGFPVYPRDAKVATKKTFARAGIERGSRQEEEEKRRQAILNGETNEGGEGSEDSRDTEERLRDDLEDLKDRNEELEKLNSELQEDNKELSTKVEELNEIVAEQKEQIEFLEEAEEKWREELDKAELRIDALKQTLERASTVSADREAGLIASLLDAAQLRETIACMKRRRALMLDELERKFRAREREDVLAATLRLWRTRALRDRLLVEIEDVEQRRHREVGDLQGQVSVERCLVAALRATETRLRLRLKCAAHRLLARALGSTIAPFAHAHALHAWTASHPTLVFENLHEKSQRELKETQAELTGLNTRMSILQTEHEEAVSERSQLANENVELHSQLEFFKENAGGSKAGIEARLQADKDKDKQHKQAFAEVEQRLKVAQAAFEQEKENLAQEIQMLESRLAVAEANASAGEGGVPQVDEFSRVVPKGTGVLCVGCLTQLVHRGIQPLPPVLNSRRALGTQLDKGRDQFFEQELQGMPDPKDPIHTYVWKAKKDPYGVARLTIWPESAGGRNKNQSAVLSSTASEPCLTPSTGLPALKKSRKLRAEGVASPLKMTNRDFRPANFR